MGRMKGDSRIRGIGESCDQGGQRKELWILAGVGQGVGRVRQESEKDVQHGNRCRGWARGAGEGRGLSREAQRCPSALGIKNGKGFTVSTTVARSRWG